MNEKDKLKILLDHWVEHNDHHCEEFTKWAKRARDLGMLEISADIKHAVEQMKAANRYLLGAVQRLCAGGRSS